MDPVNKWLTVIILFMIATLYVLWSIGGSGRYAVVVQESVLFSNHAVVYVLDTKDGDVKAKLVDENDLVYNGKNPKTAPQTVFEQPSGYSNRRY